MHNLSIYLLILLLHLDTLTSGILFEYRLRCPDTAKKWRENKNSYICHGDTEYHCMQDQHGRYVVFCASSIWIQPDYCPEFNAKVSLIDVILCQGAVDGCPGNIYLSNTVYQYPSCFRTVIRSTSPTPVSDNGTVTRVTKLRYTTTRQTKPGKEEKRDLTVSTGFILGIILGIILPILVILAIIVFMRRIWQNTYEKETKSCVNYTEPDNLKNEEETESPELETTPFLEDSKEKKNTELRKEEPIISLRLYKKAVETLKKDGFIIIVGGPGSGKSTFANYILKKEYKNSNVFHMKPKQTTLPELTSDVVVVWDDCFGIWADCELEENVKTDIRKTIGSLIDECKGKENHKALICMDVPFDVKYFIQKFKEHIINLSEHYETLMEREHLKNMFDNRIYVGNISKDVGFPLLVKLIVEHYWPIEQNEEFMKKPVEKLTGNFNDLFKNDRDVYVTLVYVVCNTPSVNQREINWKNWKQLSDECQRKDHGKSNPQQERSDDRSQLDELTEERNDIYKNPQFIELNSTLLKYLEQTENSFRFRHHFLAQLLLRFHIENVGNKGILEVANEEIKSVVKNLQLST